ncbi:probable cyclin-dependent serine/threonine-protein kinase DDB_G0292550 isoform X2 [Adelges cooleyi]|uniref:probable cyclin-dependent serine/threonine-protein kinase DDB_G0292550 isoform X2 n=1 Tax=Adelges cooleyi TaxID=133065 RepID=UPI0021802FA8|nr:probable cyclin-dependent serine/threonine-protein kinase DDB_G0292550 isoform X2 [Adelges cooleyi]
MLRFFIFLSIYLATYVANAEHSVLENDAKPVMPSGLQMAQNTVGKNNVVGDFKMNNSLGNIQTTVRGMGTTTARYEHMPTDNFQTIPQQNNRASNSNTMPKRRNRHRNNRNNNRRYSQSYWSPSSPPLPSPFNNWDNFNPFMTPQIPYPPPTPQMYGSNYNTNVPFNGFNNYKNENFGYSNGNNFNPFMTPPIPYPPPTPQIGSNDNPYNPFNGFNNYNNENFGFSNNNNFNPFMTPPIPYPPPTPNWINGSNYYPNIPFNGFNDNKNENFGFSNGIDLSNGLNITFNHNGLVINGKQIPIDTASTQEISINFNDKDGLTVNGKKIQFDAVGNPLNAADIDGSGKTSDNLQPISTPTTLYPPPQQQYNCIPYKGLVNLINNCYADGSPNISLYDGGVIINGKKIPIDIGSIKGASVKFNEEDGQFTVNGKKIPVDVVENPLNPDDVDVQLTGLNNEYHPVEDQGKKGQTVDTYDNHNKVNGEKVPENLMENQAVNVDMTGDGIKINGQEVTGDVVDNQGLKPDFQKGELNTDKENAPENVIRNKGIIVKRTDDGLLVNGKKVPGVNGYDRVVIDYDEDGITVNGERKEGFKGIKGKGRKVLGYRLNPALLDAGKSTTGDGVQSMSNVGNVNAFNNDNSLNSVNNVQNSKSRKGGQHRNRRKQQQFNN